MSDENFMDQSQILLYQTEDGRQRIEVRLEDETVWLSQKLMAELFQTTPQNINIHLKNIFSEGEISSESVIKESLITASDNKKYRTQLYRLEVIIAVGYRVNSHRGTQFRQWATSRLREYLVKGFIIDEARLKGTERFDYFDELLEKIREIRASEKRFYQKVKEVYATSVDYDGQSERAQKFFATVQNKMFHAVTGKTAAELVTARADATKPNMGLTSWKGSRVRKSDITTAKNYLADDEIKDLNRIVTMFLDVAEDRAARRKEMTMAAWETELDRFMAYNERPVLKDAGSISHGRMEQIAGARYTKFDAGRKNAELEAAEIEHTEELKRIEKAVTQTRSPKKRV